MGVLQDKEKSGAEYGFPTQDNSHDLTELSNLHSCDQNFQLESQNLKKLKIIEKKDPKNSEKSLLKQEVLSEFSVR